MSDNNDNNKNIVWSAAGSRTVVTEEEAKTIRADWDELMKVDGSIVTTVDISCRSWRKENLEILNLSDTYETITVLKIDDIIASLPTDDGLASLEYIANIYSNAPKLHTVNLSDNAIGTRGINVLMPLLQTKTIQHIQFCNCGIAVDDCQTLYEIFTTNDNNLRSLDVGRNMVGPGGAKYIGQLIGQCKYLESFSYKGSRPGPQGTLYITQGLAQMPSKTLHTLDLSDCTLTGDDIDMDAIEALCDCIKDQKGVHTLILRDTECGVDGIERIVQALQISNTSLHHLDIGGCCLEQDGIEHVCTYLQNNDINKLEYFNIETNELGDDGIRTIIEVLASINPPKLHTLILDCNEIETDGINAIINNKITNLHTISILDNMDIHQIKYIKKLQNIYTNIIYDDELIEDNEEEDEDNNEKEEEKEIDQVATLLNKTKL